MLKRFEAVSVNASPAFVVGGGRGVPGFLMMLRNTPCRVMF